MISKKIPVDVSIEYAYCSCGKEFNMESIKEANK